MESAVNYDQSDKNSVIEEILISILEIFQVFVSIPSRSENFSHMLINDALSAHHVDGHDVMNKKIKFASEAVIVVYTTSIK